MTTSEVYHQIEEGKQTIHSVDTISPIFNNNMNNLDMSTNIHKVKGEQQEQQPQDTDTDNSFSAEKEEAHSGKFSEEQKHSMKSLHSASKESRLIKVERSILRNVVGNGLYHPSFWKRLFSSKKAVRVTVREDGRSDSLFYAPFPEEIKTPGKTTISTESHFSNVRDSVENENKNIFKNKYSTLYSKVIVTEDEHSPTPTHLIPLNPCGQDVNNLVHPSDDFEISFVGISSPPKDFKTSGNELFLYSLQNKNDLHEDEVGNTIAVDEDLFKKNGINYSASNVPKVHYDPLNDGSLESTTPDSFFPIPASRSIYLQHYGSSKRSHTNTNTPSSNNKVPIKFCVLDIDKISGIEKQLLTKLFDASGTIADGLAMVPSTYTSVVSSAMDIANSIGKSTLKKYTSPDKVIQKDLQFLLYDPDNNANNTSNHLNSYLRYGYYFILQNRIDAKLFAQTNSSTQNINLLLKRYNLNLKNQLNGEKPFFPLSGNAYVVLKVERGCTDIPKEERKIYLKQSQERLSSILSVNSTLESLSSIHKPKGR